MKNSRAGETQHHPFRTERVYHSNNAWYFMIRGGEAHGPFDDREAAQEHLDKYITSTQQRDRASLDQQNQQPEPPTPDNPGLSDN